MKKIFTLLVALTTFAIGLNAEVFWTESFNRNAGQLNVGDCRQMGNDVSNWWFTGSKTTYIQVYDTTLTKAGYCSQPAGKAIQFKGATDTDVRAFKRVEAKAGTSIYYSVLIDVRQLKNSTSKEMLVTLTDGSTTAGYCYAELRFLNNYSAGTYQLGVTKANEVGVRWSEPLPTDSTILAVVRYDFIDGSNNDEAYLWINPTKLDESKPTTQCVQDTASSSGNPWGAKEKADPTGLKWVYLKPTANTVNIILDEIRVATKWADLFESGGTDPALGVNPASITESAIFQGDKKNCTISVTGQALPDKVTISNSNKEITLSQTTITKAAAEAGASFTATITANTPGTQKDTIVLTSGSIVKKIPVQWYTYAVMNCASVKALKDSVNGKDAYEAFVRLTGEAVVTRDTTIDGTREWYVEDATGAAKFTDGNQLSAAVNMVGAKIKNLLLLNGEVAWGLQPFIIYGTPTIVSTGNKVEPQVVTLAELQANAADYVLELVQVQKVTFADAGGTFSAKNWAISQGEKTANVKVEMGVGITGTTIPVIANVTGFSFNTSGNMLVPRGPQDIMDANPVLLQNGSFEKYKTSSSPYGAFTTFDDWDMSGISGVALAVETSDVLEGAAAFKTTKDVSVGYIYQEINSQDYVTGDLFDARICYKNLDATEDAITLDCYWSEYSGVGPESAIEQTDEMKQVLPNSAVWDTITFRTAKPAKAKYFVMRFKIEKNAQVLMDNLDFSYYEDSDPYFAVLPEKSHYSFTTSINTDTVVAKLTIRQRNLTQPVKLVWSKNTDKTIYSVSKSEVTAAEETVEVRFKSTQAGKFNATLNIMDDESAATSMMNTAISFAGEAIDPSKKPELVVTPQSFETFQCKAYQEVSDTIFLTSRNCRDDVHIVANEQTGVGSLWAFGLSDSYFLKNNTDTVILTFAPKKAGRYTARIKAYTEGVDTIFIDVVGIASEGKPEPIYVDWDTVFTWNMSNPYTILNEPFSHADTCHNKTLKTTDWQNVVLSGQRPWWGYTSDTTTQAKVTSYYSDEESETMPMEDWLVTPPLDYKNTAKQVFTFKVMGDFMQDSQTAKLEVYLIDATDPKQVWMEHIAEVDEWIPANDNELNGQWVDIPLVLAGLGEAIPDVFFMAFRFTDNGGKNGVIYNITDVTWGVRDVPTDLPMVDDARCAMHNGKYIIDGRFVFMKDGKRYNIFGQQQ